MYECAVDVSVRTTIALALFALATLLLAVDVSGSKQPTSAARKASFNSILQFSHCIVGDFCLS